MIEIPFFAPSGCLEKARLNYYSDCLDDNHFSSISTASNGVLPTFLTEWVTAPARQRTSAL